MIEVACPNCWEAVLVEEPERSEFGVSLVVDCEVCCRPMTLFVYWSEETAEPQVEVEAES